MAALRPIERDPLAGPWLNLEDRYRTRQRERPRAIAQRTLVSNTLGNSPVLTGARQRSGIRGGTFAPRAVSGML